MKWKKELLKKSVLYAIIDKEITKNKSLDKVAKRIADSGVKIIQYRNKEAKRKILIKEAKSIKKILSKQKILFIVNDYLDVAKIVDSDGLHLGQNDLSLKLARKILGRDKIIGISCHNLRQAIKAEKEGADYISIGPIFPTPLKPEYKTIGTKIIKKIKNKIKIPFFVIGGVNLKNLNEVLSMGAKRVAVCRLICQAKNIPFTTKKILSLLKNNLK